MKRSSFDLDRYALIDGILLPHVMGGLPEEAFDQRSYLLNGSPAASARLSETFPRDQIVNDIAAAITSGVMTSVAIPLTQGDVVTNLTFQSGATAASTPTHWWFALYSNAATPALLAQTADQTTTAWGADTAMTLALSAPQTIVTSGVYYAAIMMSGTTMVSLIGRTLARAALAAGVVTGQVKLALTSGSALTNAAPATIASPSNSTSQVYAVAT